jgi:hypothetical protein
MIPGSGSAHQQEAKLKQGLDPPTNRLRRETSMIQGQREGDDAIIMGCSQTNQVLNQFRWLLLLI